jgi:hypothetical protein
VARAVKKAAKAVGHAAVAVAKAAYKYSGAQDVVSCVTNPHLSSCIKAAVTVALVVSTAGEGEVEVAAMNAAEEGGADIAEQVGAKQVGAKAAEGAGSVGEQGTLFDPVPYRAPDSEPEMGYLYQKLSSTEEHLKYGYTKNPETRYTQAEMNGGRLNILAYGPKEDMLALERNLHENFAHRTGGRTDVPHLETGGERPSATSILTGRHKCDTSSFCSGQVIQRLTSRRSYPWKGRWTLLLADMLPLTVTTSDQAR